MNFFERQAQVKKVSGRLVVLFVLAVLGIVAVLDLAAWFGFGLSRQPAETAVGTLVVISLGAMLLIGGASWFRMLSLRNGGGGKIARSLGGVYVDEDTTDPQLRRLRNVVEEIAIASSTPVPELYLLPQEDGINAFAAGWSPADAAVAVTRGALERLNRDELQGVIAHEFSHVVNGDMRINIRLMGVLFGILGLAVIGRILLYSGRGNNKSAAPIIVVGLAAFVAGYIGVFVGRLIKAAVSRQREYLADASAVQFTRQTAGIAGALKKIGGLESGSKLRSGKVEDVSHMLFGEGRSFASLYATHPPLPKRIQLLDPTFDPAEIDQLRQRWATAPPSGLQEDMALGLVSEPDARPRAAAGDRTSAVAVHPDAVVAGVGDPGAASYTWAANILRSIPDELQQRARRVDTVVAVVFGLLMSDHPDARAAQHRALAARHGTAVAEAAWQEGSALTRLDPDLKLPLAELAFSALRNRQAQELETITGSIYELIRVDGRTTVFEYCLASLLRRELHEVLYHRSPWEGRRTTLAAAGQAVSTLLAVLARVGHRDALAADAAYRAGAGRMPQAASFPYAPPQQGLVALDAVWPVLDGLDGPEKALVVAGLVDVIAHDGVMTVEEIELLRTVCGLLHCPLPPVSPGVAHPHGAPAGS